MREAGAERSKARYMYFTEADYKALTAGLLAKWPRMRFVPKDIRCEFEPEAGWQPKPADLAVPYYADLWAGGESWVIAWLEPEGWQPEWRWYWKYGDQSKGGMYAIHNEPRLQLTWQNSRRSRSPLSPGIKDGWMLRDGRVYAYYPAFDDEYASLVRRVCRSIEKFATNQAKFVWWRWDEQDFLSPRPITTMWVGHDALRWLAESRFHALNGHTYLYTPEVAEWMETVRASAPG
jgi:hypothetical protein